MKNFIGDVLLFVAMGILGVLLGVFATVDTTVSVTTPSYESTSMNLVGSLDRACLIRAFSDLGETCGSGSLIANGWIVTARHVVFECTSVVIEWADGTEEESTDIRLSKEYDVAFIRTQREGTFVSLSDNLQDLDKVYCVGSPFGDIKHAILLGRVVRNLMEVPHWKYGIVVDMTSIGGMSGGGCYDEDGKFIGVLVGYFSPNALTIVIPQRIVLDQYFAITVMGENYVQAYVSKQIFTR